MVEQSRSLARLLRSRSTSAWAPSMDTQTPALGAAIRMGPPGRGGCVSWENFRNLLKRNRPILHQLGKKPREINVAPGTRAPQQKAPFAVGTRVTSRPPH